MQSSQEPPFVKATGLTKIFKDFWFRPRVVALDNLDLSILPGEVHGLLGSNGAGKSTTIKLLLGLLFPTSGDIEVFGKPPGNVSAKNRIGYLPEESYLYGFLDAGEILDYYARLFNIPRDTRSRRIAELLEMVGLQGMEHRPLAEFSKGMQRRIGIAQALINNPDLVILDEPTNGLDPAGRSAMLELISRLHREQGKSILLSSHLLGDVERVCDSVVILDKGRVLAHGEVGALASSRANSYRIQVSGSQENLGDHLGGRGVEVEALPWRGGAVSRDYIVTLPEQADTRLLFEVFAAGGAAESVGLLSGLWPHEENLETVFERIVAAEAGAETGKGETG